MKLASSRRRVAVALALGSAVVGACGATDRDDEAWPGPLGGTETGSSDDAGEEEDDDGGDGGGADTETDGGVRFDVGGGTGGPGDEGTECTRVDFLFVIDASESMWDYQQNLVANFPTFIDGIRSTLTEIDDFHVGVVVTNPYRFTSDECEGLGGLVTGTNGTSCGPYAAGHNYMTEQDDLAQSFTCAARLGTDGGNREVPVLALQAVLDGSLAGPGQCNEGYLRDDSLLIVVVITDEADGPGDGEVDLCTTADDYCTSPGTPQEWFDAIVAARGGIEENVVMLSLVNYEGGACPPHSQCPGYADACDGKNLVELTRMFTHGVVGGICEDYGPYFSQAIGVIDSACDGYTPPG